MAVQAKVQSKPLGQLVQNGLIGGAIAAVANLVIFFVAGALLGELTVAMQPGQPLVALPLFAVVVASIIPALVAALFLGVLQRFLDNGTRIFQIVAVLFLLVSLFPPFGQTGSTAVAIVLVLMHLVTGGAIIWTLTLRS